MVNLAAFASRFLASVVPFSTHSTSSTAQWSGSVENVCAQAEPLLPDQYNVSKIWDAKDKIIEWHRGIIRVPTETFDDMGVLAPGEDSRWDIFAQLHEYLETAYPLIHKHLKRSKVDTYGLIYEWIGTNSSLKPIFLAAHQDVVPVLPETLYQWKQDPYNGTYDGTYIWGRGSNDDKSGMTATMAAIELLLENSDFRPARTVILGFGHDEEIGGNRGAVSINEWMLENYGRDSVSLIVDEGSGIVGSWGQTFGTVGTGEKGRVVVNMTVSTLGGHSSVPPRHTNIGLTSLLIAALERNATSAELERSSPIYGYLQCAAEFAPDMPSDLRKDVRKSGKDNHALKQLPDAVVDFGLGDGFSTPGMGNKGLALISTTQAIDMIHGGFKVNALPELVTVIIDHRVDVSSSVNAVFDHIFDTILPVAKEHNLTIISPGQSFTPATQNTAGQIHLAEAFNSWLEPAPVSPTTLDVPAWRVFAATSRGVYRSRPAAMRHRNGDLEGDELVMAPYMATGNTDTRRYHSLTTNIYRWKHLIDIPGSHTVNERIVVDGLLEYTRFYQALILNADAALDL